MAGFVIRMPSYWRVDRSQALKIRNHLDGLPLYVTSDVHVFPPESITAYLNWQHHGVELNESSAEARAFLDLSKGHSALIDIGAQTGFMSALFARSREHPCRILSVEPDPQVLPLLRRAIAINGGPHVDWAVSATAVLDISGNFSMPISNRLHEHQDKTWGLAQMDVPVVTMRDLLNTIEWVPDIIKMDIESFEYEVLSSSLEIFERLKPALQLEIHWKMLEKRGRNAADFLAPLASLGYRGLRIKYRDLNKWLRLSGTEPVSRLSLYSA
jgi:FkbM family methyltransferase